MGTVPILWEIYLGGRYDAANAVTIQDSTREIMPGNSNIGRQDGPFSNLTARETEVMSLMAQGHTYNKIADILQISDETVKTHMKNIRIKLGAKNRIAAIVAFIQASSKRSNLPA